MEQRQQKCDLVTKTIMFVLGLTGLVYITMIIVVSQPVSAPNANCSWNAPLGVPISRKGLQLCHSSYMVNYDTTQHLPIWTSYVLNSTTALGCTSRKGMDFTYDPLLQPAEQQRLAGYGKLYDRGHMAPFADLSYSPISAKESFYATNFALQTASLNRGAWEQLESRIRWWSLPRVANGHTIQVIVGTKVFAGSKKMHNTTVPDAFYKVIVDVTTGDYGSYLFYANATSRVATIREIEQTFVVIMPSGWRQSVAIDGDKKSYNLAKCKKCDIC